MFFFNLMSGMNLAGYVKKTKCRVWRKKYKKNLNLLHERDEVRFVIIKAESNNYPVAALCRVMLLSWADYFDWLSRPD